MSLPLQRWLVRSVGLAVVVLTVLRLVLLLKPVELVSTGSATPTATTSAAIASETPLVFGDLLEKPLRRPLYDPPPPPPPVVEKPPPQPLRVKLVGTIIEPTSPQAILELPGGQVVFRRRGEPLSDEFPDVVISDVLATEIRYTREGQDLSLGVGQTAN